MHIIMNNLNLSLASMYLMYIYFMRGLCNMLLHAKTMQKTLTQKKLLRKRALNIINPEINVTVVGQHERHQ